MRKIDKQLNIAKANLLSEQRYLTIKEGLDEDWKTNLAAGAASLAGAAGANAQQAPQQAQNQQNVNKVVQQQAPQAKQDNSGIANPYGVDMSAAIGHVKPIVKIQTGVQDGKTGYPSVYVFHKDPNDPTFNPATDRETVFTKNLDQLRNTTEYQDYLKMMHAKTQKQQQGVAVNESNKTSLLEAFNNVLNNLK